MEMTDREGTEMKRVVAIDAFGQPVDFEPETDEDALQRAFDEMIDRQIDDRRMGEF